MSSFRFFALEYLNAWWADDRRFVAGLSISSSPEKRLTCLQEVASYYRVSRTLPIRPEARRLSTALLAIDACRATIDETTLNATVHDLASEFRSAYGKSALSASSKFLWVKHRSPVIIYDSRAVESLRSGGGRFDAADYGAYRHEWLRQFVVQEDAIRQACADLVDAKSFSLANSISDEELTALTTSRWFRERVFDRWLWWKRPEHFASRMLP